MWFNSTVNEKPYQDWKSRRRGAETCLVRKNGWTGAAWPSSARGLNCSLKWGNERNPHCLLQVSGKTAQPKANKIFVCFGLGGRRGWRQVSMALWCLGLHTCYNGYHNRTQWREPEQIPKGTLSSDWSLQLDFMKLELLVIAGQHTAVNTFSSLVLTNKCARQRIILGG